MGGKTDRREKQKRGEWLREDRTTHKMGLYTGKRDTVAFKRELEDKIKGGCSQHVKHIVT